MIGLVKGYGGGGGFVHFAGCLGSSVYVLKMDLARKLLSCGWRKCLYRPRSLCYCPFRAVLLDLSEGGVPLYSFVFCFLRLREDSFFRDFVRCFELSQLFLLSLVAVKEKDVC